MKKIVVASQNPVKANATQAGFERMFPEARFEVETVRVESGVPDQPITDAETLRGAENRAAAARAACPAADYWVGIEGGIEDLSHGMLAYAWIVILGPGPTGKGRTGGFLLPEAVATMVRSGHELGAANDRVFGRENSKQQEGAIGLLTENTLDRTELYEHGVLLALAPIKSARFFE